MWSVIKKRCKHNFRIKLIRKIFWIMLIWKILQINLIRKLCLQTFQIKLIRNLPYQHPWRRRRRRGTYLDNADARMQQHHRQHPRRRRRTKVTKKTKNTRLEGHEEDAEKDRAQVFLRGRRRKNEGHEEAGMARKKQKWRKWTVFF